METQKTSKKTLVFTGIAAVVVLLIGIGIGNSGSASNTSEVTASQAPAPAPEKTIDDIYLETLRETNNPIINAASDQDLIALGHQVCDTIESGVTVEAIMWGLIGESDGTESDNYWEFAGLMIGGGVAAYCPEYEYQIN